MKLYSEVLQTSMFDIESVILKKQVLELYGVVLLIFEVWHNETYITRDEVGTDRMKYFNDENVTSLR